MKNIKLALGIVALLFLTINYSCKNNTETNHHDDKHHQEMHQEDCLHHKNDNSVTHYACPMKCEKDKIYHKEGKCPICGMDLEEVK